MTKNEQIAETFKQTMQRRQTQVCKVIECKVKKHMLNKHQQEYLKMMFVEAKWVYNYLLNLSNETQIDLFKFDYKQLDRITHYNKDKQMVDATLEYLGSSMKYAIIQDMCTSIKTLSKLKKKGLKIGGLKFKSEYTSINLKQYNITHKIVSKNRIKVQGIKKPLPVTGLKQFNKLNNYELANAHLVQKCGDYYIQLTVLTPKENNQIKIFKNKQLGIDFGCQTSFTMSDGFKVNSYIEETDHLKKLQRKLHRQQKGSNNRWKTRIKIRKQYQRLNNLKNEYTNQLVHKWLTNNE